MRIYLGRLDGYNVGFFVLFQSFALLFLLAARR